MEHTTVTMEDFITEIRAALEYGKSLGYAECLNQTISKKPETSNPSAAMKHYIETLIEDYTQK
jgi:hypothetical protein